MERSRLLDRPLPGALLVFAVALLANAVYLTAGFQADDLLLIELMEMEPRLYEWWRGLWSVFEIPVFTDKWWYEAGADGSFWRPIPSFVFEGSIALFGEVALPLHLLSLVLHGGVGVLLLLLVRRVGAHPRTALASGLLFVLCEDHSMGVGWIATQTDLLCVFSVLLALHAQLSWLQHRRPVWLGLMLVALALAFGSKESAATAPIALVLLAWFLPDGRDEGALELGPRLRRLLADPLSWAPALGALVLFMGAYRLAGLGHMNNLTYQDPIGQPVAFLGNLVWYLPVLFMGVFTPAPPSLTLFEPHLLVPLAVVGWVVLAAAFVGWWPIRSRPLAGWAAATFLVALLPQAATDPSERALYFPFVGAAVALALLLEPLLVRGSPRPSRFRRVVGWYVLLGIAAPGALLSVSMAPMYKASFDQPEVDSATAVPHVQASGADEVFLLNTWGSFATLYVEESIERQSGRSVDVHLLSSCHGVIHFERLDDRSFLVQTDREGWLSNMFARLVRVDPVLEQGRVYDREHFDATLVEVLPDGSDVLAVRFELDRPLSDPSLLFLAWDGSAFVPLDVAVLPVGEPHLLFDSSDPWAAM